MVIPLFGFWEDRKNEEFGVKYENSFLEEFLISGVHTGVDDIPDIFDVSIEVKQNINGVGDEFWALVRFLVVVGSIWQYDRV